jgi:sRNA-binding protein
MTPAETLATMVRLQSFWRLLREACPESFADPPPAPLAIGVHAQLVELGSPLTEPELSQFLVWYTTSDAHLEATATGSHRINVDGSLASEISAGHREWAKGVLAKRRARQQRNGELR